MSRSWWDEECEEKRKEVRKRLREWRSKGGGGEGYRRERAEYKLLCKKKKKEEEEKLLKEAAEARTEGEVWRIVNRERKRWKGVDEGIGEREWKDYFMKLLGGVEGKVTKGGKRKRERDEEHEIKEEEIRRIVVKMKEGKAAGMDGVPGEVWKFGGEKVEGWMWRFCNKVWRGEGWPEQWKEGVIVPLGKKGTGDKVEDYRGVTLMPTLYKVYVGVLTERLMEEVEEKEIIPQCQTGFRKGMGVMDDIYVLNYLVNRQLERKGGMVVATYVDLKAAFDSVDREVLMEALRERGIREGLRSRIEEVYRETKSRVRVGGKVGESFWTARGVRQGCPMSPYLFNIILADMEEVLRRGGWGGVKLGEERVYCLAYADDMVLLAENEEGMIHMLGKLESYLEKKKLEVNVGKTKVMRFRKGGGRMKKVKWRWKGKEIEEVKEFTYLGYRMKRNGGQEAQVKDRVRKAGTVIRQVWGIGKRRFAGDWEKRIWLCERLIGTVMEFGTEIWGWKERREVEAMQERWVRWTFGMDWCTPGYLVREETGKDKFRIRAGRRAVGFERKLEEGRGGRLARKCLEEMKKRIREGRKLSSWEEERKKFFEERGKEVKEMEEKRGRGEDVYEGWETRDRERQKEDRWEGIRESRYNRWYKEIKEEGIPDYLKKGWGESRWRRVMRFRLNNEMKEARYWEEEEKRACRICGRGEETWAHVIGGCMGEEGGENWGEKLREILGQGGEGEWWMRDVEKKRGLGGEREEVGGEERNG